jgi:hypothetical protein
MFLIAVSILACGLLVAGGVAMAIYSATSLLAGSVKFWAGIASSSVWLLGGAGGLLCTWNWYRSFEGESNWMTEARVNLLDRGTFAIAGVGILFLFAGLVASPWISNVSVYALELLGGMVLIPSLAAISIRALMRRAARLDMQRASK